MIKAFLFARKAIKQSVGSQYSTAHKEDENMYVLEEAQLWVKHVCLGGAGSAESVVCRRHEFTGMARIEELPVEGQLQTLFGDAKGVAGKVTMLAVGLLNE